jgi:D-alanyl-D-alanine carboxypeptidase
MCAMLFSSNKVTSQAQSIDLERIAAGAREKFNLPSVVIIVLNSEGVMQMEVQGVRANNQAPVSHDDFFHIGSCSKSVLSTIAGKLVEENKISWDTRFFELYPEMAKTAQAAYHHITLEDLLLCKAGIQPFVNMEKEPFANFGDTKDEKYAFARFLLEQPPSSRYKNGSFDFLYSNASYSLASIMLEKATGMSYEQLIHTFGMQLQIETYIGFPNTYHIGQPWGHLIQGKKIELFPPDHAYKVPSIIKPAGDLSMKPLGYAKYIQMHLKGLRGEGNFLSDSTFQHIHYGHKAFSMGVSNGKFGGIEYSGMDGSAGTFFCRSMLAADADFAFIIMTNAGSATGRMKAVEWMTYKIAKKYFNLWWMFWV